MAVPSTFTRSRYPVLRPDYLELCAGDRAAATLLALIASRARGDGWVRLTLPEIREASWWLTEKLARAAVGRLLELGHVERRPAGNPDRAYEYRLVRQPTPASEDAVDPPRTNPSIRRKDAVDPPDLARARNSDVDVSSSTDVGVVPKPSLSTNEKTTPSRKPKREPEESPDIRELWGYYQRLVVWDAKPTRLAKAHRELLEEALAAFGMEACKEAIFGLSVSPFYNGDNDTGAKFLDVWRAFAPARGGKKKADPAVVDRMRTAARKLGSPTSRSNAVSGVTEGLIATAKDRFRKGRGTDRDRELLERHGVPIPQPLDEEDR